ncbi:MAG TPA: PepSY-like domain-containing protein [Chitinophagaceae bacterium]|jgi:uncharacterized membrane protein YkoI|nr:PepSY-like domain-containing protein [Chitinophagaceae bacterium]
MKLKTLMLAASIAVLASCGPSYRVTDGSTLVVDVPSGIQKSFTTQYPTATTVVWSTYDVNAVPIDLELNGWPAMDEGDYVVTFNMNNDKYYAWYDANGDWIGTAYVVTDYKSLPSSINTMIVDKFPGYTITSVNREMQKDRIAYEIQLKNGDSKTKLLVDENGNIIKQKTVTK